ncbi:HlyD family type I secretion periplasmic adaptor subunit [Salmonella enterica]|nr:HlyD family type I secretion periplasmic adaptor subunit [Salmonella enterica]EKF0974719.1 HlyD family type I secretion periplasmic adaptor subunit [Salmonella enterica]
MLLYFHALYNILKKYYMVIKESWTLRKNLAWPIRRIDEYDFLPAHIELMEKPSSPLARFVAYIIVFILIVASIISFSFKVEIVAVAPGKTMLSGRSKIIQPLETSKVKMVYVTDGQHVKKGELLISLIATGLESDKSKTKSSLIQTRLSELRETALIKAIDENHFPVLPEINNNEFNAEQELIVLSRKLMEDQYNSWKKSREQQQKIIAQRNAERNAIRSLVIKNRKQKEIIYEKLKDLKSLYSKNAIPRHSLLDQKSMYIDISNELDANLNRLNEMNASVSQAQDEYTLLLQNFKRDRSEKLDKIKESLKQLKYEYERIKERESASQITSPVDGVVQQLVTFTEGGVVTTAQVLMVIVPEHESLSAKVMISNKDIGFIKPGQTVIIKLDAFPYTRYGYLRGVVKTVSLESIEDKEHGVYFDCEIILDKPFLTIDNHKVSLSSGMNLSAEIITGYRRVIDFILSPLQETVNESFRER